MNRLLLMLTLLFPLVISAQSKVLRGKIENKKDVEGIHIMNTSSRYNSVSDRFGNFEITVRVNDTLVISSVHYMPEEIPVTKTLYESGLLRITLKELITELEEVVLGPGLTGNLEKDAGLIETEEHFNFDDVGIPGYLGEPEEKIVPMFPALSFGVVMDLEALYKHMSGYYMKLRIKRKWDAQNHTVARIMEKYSAEYFNSAYHLPSNRLYDFLLFCIETSDLQSDFNNMHYGRVLEIFEEKSSVYLTRLAEKEE